MGISIDNIVAFGIAAATKLRRRALVLLAFGTVVASQQSAFAYALLQLYVEGGTYNSTTETWQLDVANNTPFTIWAIGNVAGSGGKGPLYDVKLSVAFRDAGLTVSALSGTTTGGLGGFTDPSVPADPFHLQTVTDGSSPILSDGSSLPAHGIYGPGTSFYEFLLGDFTLTDSPMADFGGPSFPTLGGNPVGDGQINAYTVTLTGLSEGGFVHFDLYDHYTSKDHVRAVNAPFSHDGQGNGDGGDEEGPLPGLPEPTSVAVWSVLSLAFVGARWLPKRHRE